ncbi:hypothetical protein Cob_v005186 [Colletotrichum orbiculare MAFF 240422]|uniref:Uncharacterized protein n=1 Tax=Colletotrichum orbiculare (strain 104-T / ATCC 96160 / CBS 514.97 / LARS 414 / MAFF 240422) TaxID=1213857 RepID=A0A484FVE9_COLOR|nr:hypothetical protein Cob_v005186 [Colletotrichum orbiculare MAFF 240422]
MVLAARGDVALGLRLAESEQAASEWHLACHSANQQSKMGMHGMVKRGDIEKRAAGSMLQDTLTETHNEAFHLVILCPHVSLLRLMVTINKTIAWLGRIAHLTTRVPDLDPDLNPRSYTENPNARAGRRLIVHTTSKRWTTTTATPARYGSYIFHLWSRNCQQPPIKATAIPAPASAQQPHNLYFAVGYISRPAPRNLGPHTVYQIARGKQPTIAAQTLRFVKEHKLSLQHALVYHTLQQPDWAKPCDEVACRKHSALIASGSSTHLG